MCKHNTYSRRRDRILLLGTGDLMGEQNKQTYRRKVRGQLQAARHSEAGRGLHTNRACAWPWSRRVTRTTRLCGAGALGDLLEFPATHHAEIMLFWKMTKSCPYVILNSNSHPGSLMKFMI